LILTSRARIVAAREAERLRLRRELHDGLGPTLAALGLKIDAARDQAAAGRAADVVPLLDEIRGDVRGVVAQIRGVSRELRPPTIDSLGLVGGLRQQIEALTAGGPTIVALAANDIDELPPGVEVAGELTVERGRHGGTQVTALLPVRGRVQPAVAQAATPPIPPTSPTPPPVGPTVAPGTAGRGLE